MQLPSLKDWIATGKKLWNMATPTNRKIFFPNAKTWDEYKNVLKENWNKLKRNPDVFVEESKRTHNALKMALDKIDNSKKFHDKAMRQVEAVDEGEKP